MAETKLVSLANDFFHVVNPLLVEQKVRVGLSHWLDDVLNDVPGIRHLFVDWIASRQDTVVSHVDFVIDFVRVAVVDVNVSRVLSRLEGVPMKARALQDFADELVPQGLGWEWNQVMMDFGARHCTVRSPLCDSCPVRAQCKYKGYGEDPAQLSAGVSKPQPRFEGSDRQARGRALRAVGDGSQQIADVIAAMRVDEGRAEKLIASLVDEGLLQRTGKTITLP